MSNSVSTGNTDLISILAIYIGLLGAIVLLTFANWKTAVAGEQAKMTPYVEYQKGKSEVASPDGAHVVVEDKAQDGYHDTIWLRNIKTGQNIDLLAPGDEKWPGSGATEILGWLDDDRIAFTWHCGTGCTSLELINIVTHQHTYYCTDGGFHVSPDLRYVVGQSDNPYEVADKRGGLAVIALDYVSDYDGRRACTATIPGYFMCSPEQAFDSRDVRFDHWSPDGKSFAYTVIPCVGGRWRPKEKRVFYLDSSKSPAVGTSGRSRQRSKPPGA